VIAVGAAAAVLLALRISRRLRVVLLAVALAALFAAPVTWAAETIGHATSSTFPTGGPASAGIGGFGGFGKGRGGVGPGGFRPPAALRGGSGATGAGSASGAGAVAQLFGHGGSTGSAGGFAAPGMPGGISAGRGRSGGFGGGAGGFGGDSQSLDAAIRYAKAHGGGTIGVESQSTAAAAIISSNANVAGLGGFSGRESSVSVSWLATEVRDGHLRWVIDDGQAQGGGVGGDTRTGSQTALDAVAKACRKVTVTTGSTGTGTVSSTGTGTVTMYDCLGRPAAILAAG
jgi:hypothetical protein